LITQNTPAVGLDLFVGFLVASMDEFRFGPMFVFNFFSPTFGQCAYVDLERKEENWVGETADSDLAVFVLFAF